MFKRNQIFKVLGVTIIVFCAVMMVGALQTKAAYVPGNGDVNGDGTIGVHEDASDLALLRECLIGSTDASILSSSDMDGDGTTTIKDIVRLKLFLYNTEQNINNGTGIVIDTTGFASEDKETVSLSDGTSVEGYVINSASELYGYASLLQNATERERLATVNLILGADIDLNKVEDGISSQWADGTVSPQNEWLPIEEFAGTFYGEDKTIRGLYMGSKETTRTNKQRGLFSVSTNPITVKDLSLTDGYMLAEAGGNIGAILGEGEGTFTQLHTDVDIYNSTDKAIWLGGIVGKANKNAVVTITKCWSEGDMSTNSDESGGVGGILGRNYGGASKVTACLYSGHIRIIEGGYKDSSHATAITCAFAGGIVGQSGTGSSGGVLTISDCLTLGVLTAHTSGLDGMGSILGYGSTDKSRANRDVIDRSWHVVHPSDETYYNKALGAKIAVVDGKKPNSGYSGHNKIDAKDVLVAKNWLDEAIDEATGESTKFPLDTTYWEIKDGCTPMLKCFLTAE